MRSYAPYQGKYYIICTDSDAAIYIRPYIILKSCGAIINRALYYEHVVTVLYLGSYVIVIICSPSKLIKC